MNGANWYCSFNIMADKTVLIMGGLNCQRTLFKRIGSIEWTFNVQP